MRRLQAGPLRRHLSRNPLRQGAFQRPCGGSKAGHCEVDPDVPCAWHLIITRMEETGRLELMDEIEPPANWAQAQGKGPRKIVREDQKTP